MIGAQLFNQTEGNKISAIYSCVITGEDWQFLSLQDKTVAIDKQRYRVNQIEKILGIFQPIVDKY